jgi:hypothetical protein
MSWKRSSILYVIALGFGVAACAERSTEPGAAPLPPAGVAESQRKFWDDNAAANWNERATALAARQAVNVSRLYAYLSLAQLRAAESAEEIRPHPPTAAAIGAASAKVLAAYFPAFAGEIDAALAAQATAEPWPGARHEDFEAGAAIGRAAAERVIAYSLGDRVGLTDPGTPPTTPGSWLWTGGPIVRGNLGARPFFLASADEFRPPPPPTFGSPAYLAALAEVRQISDTRTAEQLAIARYWNTNQSGVSNAAMNNLAVELIRKHRRGDVESARILFLMNAASFDALVGCFDAKYFYWYIRPPQADPAITLPIGLPPHPSYPSAHSCNSGSSTGVLGAEFPEERARLEAIAQEASLSRLYAGIHYRFDMVTGLALGRAVAAKAVAADLDGIAVR